MHKKKNNKNIKTAHTRKLQLWNVVDGVMSLRRRTNNVAHKYYFKIFLFIFVGKIFFVVRKKKKCNYKNDYVKCHLVWEYLLICFE